MGARDQLTSLLVLVCMVTLNACVETTPETQSVGLRVEGGTTTSSPQTISVAELRRASRCKAQSRAALLARPIDSLASSRATPATPAARDCGISASDNSEVHSHAFCVLAFYGKWLWRRFAIILLELSIHRAKFPSFYARMEL